MAWEAKQIRIRGILIPVGWDENGNITKAAVMTPDEGEYLVEKNEQSKHVYALMRQEVEVIGIVREEIGQKVITVENCKTLKRARIQ